MAEDQTATLLSLFQLIKCAANACTYTNECDDLPTVVRHGNGLAYQLLETAFASVGIDGSQRWHRDVAGSVLYGLNVQDPDTVRQSLW